MRFWYRMGRFWKNQKVEDFFSTVTEQNKYQKFEITAIHSTNGLRFVLRLTARCPPTLKAYRTVSTSAQQRLPRDAHQCLPALSAHLHSALTAWYPPSLTIHREMSTIDVRRSALTTRYPPALNLHCMVFTFALRRSALDVQCLPSLFDAYRLPRGAPGTQR